MSIHLHISEVSTMIRGCLTVIIIFVIFILFLTVFINESAKRGGGMQQKIERQER